MEPRLNGIYDFIAHCEEKHGDLNLFFYYIYDGEVTYDEIIEMLYLYDCATGLKLEYDEYKARNDKPFEQILERVREVAHEISVAIKDKTRYKPRYK